MKIKFLLIAIILIQANATFCQTGNQLSSSSLFSNLESKIEHISVSRFSKIEKKAKIEVLRWSGPIIPRRIKQKMHISFPIANALGKTSLDSENNFIAYIFGTSNAKIYLFVFSKEKNDIVFKQELASYFLVETAFEKIRNSWISDLNKDGVKEIATWERQQDFEFTNELADNSSKDERFIYYLINKEFKYQFWSSENLNNIILTK